MKKKLVIALISLSCVFIAGGFIKIANGKSVKSELSSALKYYFAGDYDRAILSYDKVLKVDKKNTEAYIGKINSFISKGDLRKAKEVSAAAIDEGLKDVRLLSINTSINDEDLSKDKKIKNYEEILTAEPDNKEAFYGLYAIYKDFQEYEKASEVLEDAVKVSKELNSFVINAIVKTENWDKALELLENTYKKDRNDISLYDSLSYFGASDKFIEMLKNKMEEDKGNSMYKFFYILSLTSKDNIDDGLSAAKEIEAEFKDNLQYKLALANIYALKGEAASAESLFNDIEKNSGTSYELFNKIAWFYYNEGQFDKALEYAKKSMELNLNYENNYASLIPSCLYKLGRFEEAIPYLTMSLSPNNSFADKLKDYFSIIGDLQDNVSVSNEDLYSKYNSIADKLFDTSLVSEEAKRVFEETSWLYYAFYDFHNDSTLGINTWGSEMLNSIAETGLPNWTLLMWYSGYISEYGNLEDIKPLLDKGDFNTFDIPILLMAEELYNKTPDKDTMMKVGEALGAPSKRNPEDESEKLTIDAAKEIYDEFTRYKNNSLFDLRFHIKRVSLFPL